MDSKQRAKSYLFWLLEYRGRRFLSRVGSNGLALLEKWMRLYDICMPPAGEEMPNFADFIKGKDDEALQRMCDYFTQYPDDFYFFGETFMVITTAEEIVSLYESGKIGETIWYILANSGIDSDCSTIEAYGIDSKEIVPTRSLPIKNGKLHLKEMSIDLSAPLENILTDITSFVCSAREQAAIQELRDLTGDELREITDKGCLGFGPCCKSRGMSCEVIDEHSFFGKVIRNSKASGYRFNLGSNRPRSLGIWIYDYARINNCSASTAMNKARDEQIPERLGYSIDIDDRALQRLVKETEKCISQGEVLSISTS